MSAPTKQFCKLSLSDNMPQTRSQQEGSPHTDSGSGIIMDTASDDHQDEGDSAQSIIIQGGSGISYDLAGLDSDSEARALVGLTSQFEVISCCATRTGYDFQLSERPRVHLDSKAYTCTCSTFTSRPEVACQHIFWLIDQLHGCLAPQHPPYDVPLASDGHSSSFLRIEGLLAGKLETVADQLNWQYARSEAEGGMSRPQKVRDIMSAFSTAVLPENFRPDLVDDVGQKRTSEQCVVQGDFEATMFRLAVHDDAVYSSLCKAMPPGACAAIYFDKIQECSRRLLADFDRYCQTGQRVSESKVDVQQVIDQLHDNVDRIQQNLFARAPHGMEGAAKALVTLLEDICNRNKDALDANRWGAVQFQDEDEDQRNLYHQLIGESSETGECFILDVLEYLPGSNLQQFLGALQTILRKNEVNRAPRAYILKLTSLIRQAEKGSTSSGQKRPSTATPEGHSKRTR
ncbi:hypothetical protein FE257_012105 [Aspergillus nanangensis]|uniref:SWIM-type domain-containing protein n=1 Tax=Aspergillus nanangensis TaxID=2582783 RepID=A0AAD4GQ83_ASPNN|nr:hypothetical protein FE257_012105 [Aspergillus nanangensis]